MTIIIFYGISKKKEGSMKLRMWLALKKMTVKDFSKLVGVSASYLSLILYDHQKPGKFLAKEIIRQTEGMVNFDESTPCCSRCGRPIELENEEAQKVAI